MKYVVVKEYLMGLEVPLLFPETLNHNTVAKQSNYHHIVSAGFAYHNDGHWSAFGDSMTLGIQSRPEDSDLLNTYFRK